MNIWTVESTLNYLYDRSVNTANGCLEWQGPLNSAGYGQIGIQSLVEAFGIKGTHRLMVHLATGYEFTSRLEFVIHACDNPKCIAPAHLSVGTPKENTHDCMAKGRYQLGKKAHDHPRKILQKYQVVMIKALLREGTRNNEIAELFDVSPAAISGIKNGRRWASVQ